MKRLRCQIPVPSKRAILTILLQTASIILFGQRATKSSEPHVALDSIVSNADKFLENHPTEKVYIHFDKRTYLTGETAWYKAYVLDEHEFSATTVSTVLYVDLIDRSGKNTEHQQLKVENGTSTGSLVIDSTFENGRYNVIAYTNWMRNQSIETFYSSSLEIISSGAVGPKRDSLSESKIDLQFLPESGSLVNGIKSKVAFKSIDSHGLALDMAFEVKDQKDSTVASVRTAHNGMGIFDLSPRNGYSYHAVLANMKRYPLPSAVQEGLTLSTTNLSVSNLHIQIRSSVDYPVSSIYLVGLSRGIICYAASVKIKGGSSVVDISIPKNKLPEGVLKLSLLRESGLPICERMVYIKKSHLAPTLTSNKSTYAPRDSVALRFKIQGVQADHSHVAVSVSVVDSDLYPRINSENIYTSLLLQSDIKGYVENAAWYFDAETPQKTYALDLVMLTHGWSRYNWKKMLSEESDTINFLPERGLSLRGQVFVKNSLAANFPFVLELPQPKGNIFTTHLTDSLGHFDISGIDFYDTTSVIVRFGRERKGVQYVKIVLDTVSGPARFEMIPARFNASTLRDSGQHEKLAAKYARSGVWTNGNAKVLEEVEIKANRISATSIGRGSVLVKPTPADLKSSAHQLVSRYAIGLPNAHYVQRGDGGVWMTASTPPKPIVISINGMMEDTSGVMGNPYLIVSKVSVDEIDNIIISGSNHDGYFIAITTKKLKDQTGIVKLLLHGYDGAKAQAREFYHPKYGPHDVSGTAADNRLTLYWNPSLVINEKGEGIVSFYNSDTAKKFMVVVNGIVNGEPLSFAGVVGRDEN